jgi:hypothetical protein
MSIILHLLLYWRHNLTIHLCIITFTLPRICHCCKTNQAKAFCSLLITECGALPTCSRLAPWGWCGCEVQWKWEVTKYVRRTKQHKSINCSTSGSSEAQVMNYSNNSLNFEHFFCAMATLSPTRWHRYEGTVQEKNAAEHIYQSTTLQISDHSLDCAHRHHRASPNSHASMTYFFHHVDPRTRVRVFCACGNASLWHVRTY